MTDLQDSQYDPQSDSISFPVDTVVAVVDDPDAAESAVDALVRAGVPETEIQVLCGDGGARRLYPSGKRHGVIGRIRRVVQQFADKEVAHVERHAKELREGRFVLAAPAAGDEEGRRLADVLKTHGGHFINHYGKWTVKRLEE